MVKKRIQRSSSRHSGRPSPVASPQELTRLRRAVEASGEVIFMTDRDGTLTYVNPAFVRLYGYSPSEVIGRTTPRILKSGVVPPEVYVTFWQSLLNKQIMTGPIVNRAKNGKLLEVEASASPILDDKGHILGFLGIQRDITDRRQGEEALRKREAELNEAQRIAGLGSWEWIIATDTITWSEGLYRILGLDSKQPTPRYEGLAPFYTPESWERLQAAVRETLQTGLPYEVDLQEIRADGTAISTTTRGELMRDATGQTIGLRGTVLDITSRQAAERALRKREAELNEAQRVARVGSWEWDRETNAVTWSDALYRINHVTPGLPVPPFQDLAPFYPPESWAQLTAAVQTALQTGAPYELDLQQICADGTPIWVSIRGEVVRDAAGEITGLRGTVLDTTERKRAEKTIRATEDRLRQAMKMEAVGQLAGGVAHDFNNLLTVILGNASLLMEPSLQPSDIGRLAGNVVKSAERGANLTRQLLAFGRQQDIQVQRLELNQLLADLFRMLGRLLGEDVLVRCEYAPALPAIEADAGMVEQIVMNLAVNARDAMPDGGSLTISTRVVDIQPADVELNPEAYVGRFVVLAVEDSGRGMDPSTLARIFEPFFTTKDVGKGTGLGLATVHGIVKQHNGWIEVASRPGHGSVFRVFFPAAPTESAVQAKAQRTMELVGGCETILVVEDEATVRNLAVASLRRWGYQVLEAGTGLEALRVWSEHPERIDLLFTDVVMPEGMNGRELARRLRADRSDLKVVFSSGYSPVAGEKAELLANERLLPKPYTPAILAQTIRRCLDGR